MTRNKSLALTQAVQSHLAGTPVVAFEPFIPPANDDGPKDMDDCVLMYADDGSQLFNLVPDPCDDETNPTGQHVFGGRNDRLCIYCGCKSGLDR